MHGAGLRNIGSAVCIGNGDFLQEKKKKQQLCAKEKKKTICGYVNHSLYTRWRCQSAAVRMSNHKQGCENWSTDSVWNRGLYTALEKLSSSGLSGFGNCVDLKRAEKINLNDQIAKRYVLQERLGDKAVKWWGKEEGRLGGCTAPDTPRCPPGSLPAVSFTAWQLSWRICFLREGASLLQQPCVCQNSFKGNYKLPSCFQSPPSFKLSRCGCPM